MALRGRIRELAYNRVRYDYKRIHILIRREGVHATRNVSIGSIAWRGYS